MEIGLIPLDSIPGVVSLQDYPSIGHMAEALSKSNIQTIFAVTGPRLHLYEVSWKGRSGRHLNVRSLPHSFFPSPGSEQTNSQISCRRTEGRFQQCGAADYECLQCKEEKCGVA